MSRLGASRLVPGRGKLCDSVTGDGTGLHIKPGTDLTPCGFTGCQKGLCPSFLAPRHPLQCQAQGLILAVFLYIPFHSQPVGNSRSKRTAFECTRGPGVGARPCRAPRKGMDEGTPAAHAVPAVDPGLHGGSSRISPNAGLIPDAEPTRESGSQTHVARAGLGGNRAKRKLTRGEGVPRRRGQETG